MWIFFTALWCVHVEVTCLEVSEVTMALGFDMVQNVYKITLKNILKVFYIKKQQIARNKKILELSSTHKIQPMNHWIIDWSHWKTFKADVKRWREALVIDFNILPCQNWNTMQQFSLTYKIGREKRRNRHWGGLLYWQGMC